MLKPKEMYIDSGYLVAKSNFRARRIDSSALRGMRIGPVPSLCDEVGITLLGERDVFFTDAEPWFWEIAHALGIESKLGVDWYRRAEEGASLEYHGPISLRTK